eukprot:CAMPEP_0176493894 /NCGR_PEP_ID=MMETSP0200_2-20121128/9789_1 /TAXON_ID=947934 /ORGANISM="Chaetoceros sp., Strain GSL56" /LENGTH=166 /DNA_ID=CAMNT_0017891581 /DNA_START=109 /DNA_END=605 /DNA_ORIENTATION=-
MIAQILKPNYCFVYGTLMAPEVLTTLIDRVPDNHVPAFLPPEYSRHPVIGQVYPGVIARDDKIKNQQISSDDPCFLEKWNDIKSSCVSGVLLSGLNDRELKVLDWFEDVDYTRTTIPLLICKDDILEKIDADVYIWSAGEELLSLDSHWDYDVFLTEKLSDYLKST